MSLTSKKSITIVGCGLAGSYLAVLLAKRGYSISIFERLSQKEIIEEASARSYNITLYDYAINILKKTSLWQEVSPYVFELNGSITHVPNSLPVKTLGNEKKITYLTITRAQMAHILLTEAAKHPSVIIHYETPVVAINRYDKTITVKKKNKALETFQTDVIIGADGINSQVRIFLQQGQQTTHIQEYAKWSYKQFKLQENLVEKLGLEKQFEHTWTQKNTFIISHFDKMNNLSALLVYPKKGLEKDILSSASQIENFVEQNYPDLLPVLPEITKALIENPVGNFATIHTDPWYYKDFMVLVGDAAHGFYPFFGQGTSAAFGDCMTLVDLLDKHKDNWENTFKLYQQNRKENMDILGDLSKEVMNKYFRYQKADYTATYDKVESMLYTLFPKLIKPPLFYSLITDPEHATDHWENFKKQRKIQKWVGISSIVTFLTVVASVMVKSKGTNREKTL
jgi:kynurenine 3-monooxygenase